MLREMKLGHYLSWQSDQIVHTAARSAEEITYHSCTHRELQLEKTQQQGVHSWVEAVVVVLSARCGKLQWEIKPNLL